MKKLLLLLLAANIVLALWIYTTRAPQSAQTAELVDDSGAIDSLILLSELGIPKAEPIIDSATATSSPPTPSMPDNTAPNVAKSEPPVDEAASPSLAARAVESVGEAGQEVKARANEVIGLIGDVVSDIVPSNSPPARHCYTVGPFSEQAEAKSAANKVAAAGMKAAVSETEARESGGYWVYIPSDSLRSARVQIERLQKRGVTDISLLSQSSVRHLVSLGVYSTEERARLRQRALSDIGYYTRMEQRSVKTAQFWVDIELSAEQEGQGALRAALADNGPPSQPVFCR